MQPLPWPSLFSTFVILAVFIAGTTTARSEDPHELYERRCGGCHASHAGDFVRDHLVLRSGELFGPRSGQRIGAFLETGHGGLRPGEVLTLVTHFTNIGKSAGLFREKCIICHDRAVVFARNRLAVREGELIGRYSKRNIARFLTAHGRLSTSEVSSMVDVLKRQLMTSKPTSN